MALYYKDGNFVKKNDNKASDLFEQVAQSNSKYKDKANYHLAMHLIEKNKNKALFLFEQVSQSDSKYKDDAKHMLAIMNKKSLTGDKSYDTINCEYARIKKNYQQSNLTKEYNAIRVKLFNVTSVSSDYVVALNTYKTMEDDDVLNYRIKYKIGLHLLSKVSCQQDINNGFRKIVEAANFNIPDAKAWIKKHEEKKDYGAEEAKKLIYKDEYDKTMQNLKNQYKNETNES